MKHPLAGIIIVIGMFLMWLLGFSTGCRYTETHSLVNETEPRVITHTNE